MKKIFMAMGVSLFFFVGIAVQASAKPIACWDLNQDYLCDLETEDTNKDGKCNPRDCDVVEEPCYGVPKTGQTTMYATGHDGDLQKGISWPTPRFTDNGDGTVTDNLTRLIWLQDASCTTFFSGDNTGVNYRDWDKAITAANLLSSGYCALSDGSVAGDWRLPNAHELGSLIHWGFWNPALPNTAGTGQCSQGDPFLNVVLVGQNFYFTSTIYLFQNTPQTGEAWTVPMSSGGIVNKPRASAYYVWPVRDAQ